MIDWNLYNTELKFNGSIQGFPDIVRKYRTTPPILTPAAEKSGTHSMARKKARSKFGTITPLPSGNFRFQFPPSLRTMGFKSRTLPSRAAAERYQIQQQMLHGDGKLVRDGTLAEWIAQWLVIHERAWSPSTLRRYKQIVRCHIENHLGKIRLSDLNPTNVNLWLVRLARQGVKDDSRQKARMVMRAILRSHDSLDVSWFRKVKPVKVNRPEPRFLNADQYRVICQAADTWSDQYPWLGVYVRVSVECCARPGEALALRWHDYQDGVISIKQSMCDVTYKPKDLKTERSRREIRLSKKTRAMLDEWHAKTKYSDRDHPIFHGRSGKYRSPSTLSYTIWKPFVASVGIKIHPYGLRHTGCAILLSAGASLHAVAARMGHTSPQLVLSTYGHVMPRDESRLVEIHDGLG